MIPTSPQDPPARTPKQFPGGRRAWRRDQTRVRILEAASQLLQEQGVEGLRIQDVAQRADVGFGTVYNHFRSKEELGSMLLALQVHNLGSRCFMATLCFHRTEPVMGAVLATRLLVHDLLTDHQWRSWVAAPSILMDALRQGLPFFGFRRLCAIAERSRLLTRPQSDTLWGILIWMIVGTLCDCPEGGSTLEREQVLIERILAMLDLPREESRILLQEPLPNWGPSVIDFSVTP
ncbi:MAG: TetR family transcriptional regulator [Holophagaceae bacterium]|nr:TetR family transcriptional regulator [Holophagaceae bacterium]